MTMVQGDHSIPRSSFLRLLDHPVIGMIFSEMLGASDEQHIDDILPITMVTNQL